MIYSKYRQRLHFNSLYSCTYYKEVLGSNTFTYTYIIYDIIDKYFFISTVNELNNIQV